ncbi:DNA methyltransferase [Breoghania sp.]|uniref:DNA methyltransferase n=1 Tax=Breoghania sp. TaxID=2065378 RepID=UPI00374978F6
MKSRDMTSEFGDCNARLIDHWAARDSDSQPSLPTPQQWATLRRVLGIDDSEIDAEVARLNARKGAASDEWTGADIVGEQTGATPGFGEYRFMAKDRTIRKPTDAAEQWAGWGTALKPAWEPICLARKPLAGTVADTVLEYGCGAINVAACRVGHEVRHASHTSLASCSGNSLGKAGTAEARRGTRGDKKEDRGRWPANILHDGSPEVAAAFPADKDGSAARFFYSAKADATDRAGSSHPTVKPVALMRWLCRLVTPRGGVVLDPFAGSGTTGEAAFVEGFRSVLFEREPQFQADIRQRMDLLFSGQEERGRKKVKAQGRLDLDAGPLFSR